MGKPYIYVASSWRNTLQPLVVQNLRNMGADVYDFKNPEPATGFHWSEVGLQRNNDASPVHKYVRALDHPRAAEGFRNDFRAMRRADAFVLVLPCGRSAHLELGWAVGAGLPSAILLDDPCTPELMYKMVEHLATDMGELMEWAESL